MKVLHYFPTTRLTEGGTVRAAIDLCAVIAQRGHDVTWLTCDDFDTPEEWKNGAPNTPTIQTLGVFEKRGRRLTRTQLQLASSFIKDVDVVHVHAMWDLSNPQIGKLCQEHRVPWVLSIHGMLDDWSMAQRGIKKQLYLKTAGRTMIQSPAAFHTTAEEERRQVARWLKHSNIKVVPCIVDLEPYRHVPDSKQAIETFGKCDHPTVLFLSRIHEKKSIETLIEATKILKEKDKPIRLLIAGTGDQAYIETLKHLAEQCGVQEEVTFLGMVLGDLKLSLYAMADIFALPTQQENFGLVYPEALLCQTPVIGTRGTDIWRELEDAGAIIAERTSLAFADAIEELASDQSRLKELGVQGRDHVLRWLDTDRVGEQYDSMYKSVLNEH